MLPFLQKCAKLDQTVVHAVFDQVGCVLCTWETDGEYAKVSLKSGVDGEATGSGVHAGHVLHIVNLLQSQLLSIIPIKITRKY